MRPGFPIPPLVGRADSHLEEKGIHSLDTNRVHVLSADEVHPEAHENHGLYHAAHSRDHDQGHAPLVQALSRDRHPPPPPEKVLRLRPRDGCPSGNGWPVFFREPNPTCAQDGCDEDHRGAGGWDQLSEEG